MPKYRDLMDMIDGGGAGKMGGKFEGGGLLSLLANAVATPYGSEDEERRKRLMQMRGLLDMSAPPAAASPAPTTVTPPAAPRTAPAPSYATMDMGEAGRGANLGYPLQNIPPAYEYGGNRPMMEQLRQPAGTPLDGYTKMYQTASDPMFDQFMAMQKEYEQQYGFAPMSADEYLSMYENYRQRMGM